jgi:transcriptional regulator with XRE-family HTH domain
VQNNPMPLLQHGSFERWDLAESTRPCPSLLYALTPCGLGTPYVESLSSYATRLAEAHVVSVWRLILLVLSPGGLDRISRSTTSYAYPANRSEIFLRNLEAATGRRDLRLLTLSAVQRTVSQPNIFRTTEAWCPGCLEHWRTTETPVYSPLLWAIRAVTVCPIHASPLADRCPHCHSRLASLRVRARPGYCAICLQWLGTPGSPSPNDSLEEKQYNLWVSTSVGQVLAEMPDLESIELHVELIANLQRCLRQSEGSTRQYLSTLAGAAPCAFGAWISGRVKPRLDHLCRLSFELRIPLIMLFKGVPAEWRGPKHCPQPIASRRRNVRAPSAMPGGELRRLLATSLTEDPPPSVAAVARRLNFRRTQTLRAREPELCKQIAARWRDSGTIVRAASNLYKKSQRHRLERILRRHLARENPLSVNEIASTLGYKGSNGIRERFPDICRAIVSKRKQHSFQKKEHMRRALEDARTENPPPSLKQIARRFGFTAENVLSINFPDMCAAYKQWRRAWLEEQRTKLRLSIQEWVAAQPAPTVKSVCLHFRVSDAYFQLHFPEENAEVVQSSAERIRIAREHRDAVMRKEVFEIVCELCEKNIYPSLPRVKSALSPGLSRCWPLFRPTIDEAKSRFGGCD